MININVVALTKRIVDGFFGIELVALLRKVSDMRVFADDDGSRIGIDLFGEYVEQRRLAAAIWADDGTAVVFAKRKIKWPKYGMIVGF